jgi:hypothetical protein
MALERLNFLILHSPPTASLKLKPPTRITEPNWILKTCTYKPDMTIIEKQKEGFI